MNTDERLEKLRERHEAFSTKVKLMSREIEILLATKRQDGENIRALVRIAEMHAQRIDRLEDKI